MRLKTLAVLLAAVLLGSVVKATDLAEIRSLVQEGRSSEALAELEDYLADSPVDPDALFLRGLVLAETQQQDQAMGVFTQISSLRPDRPEPLNNLAVLQAARGDYETAVETLKEALRTHPAYRTAYENLTKIYGQLASEAYSRALSVDQAPTRSNVELVLLSNIFLPEIESDRIAEAEVMESPSPPLPVAVAEIESADPGADSSSPEALEPMEVAVEESMEAPEPEEIASVPEEIASVPGEVAPTPDQAIVEALEADPPEPASDEPLDESPGEPIDEPMGELAEAAEVAEGGVNPGELADLVEAWARAWSEQRVDDYLYFYGRDFVPDGEIGREDWAALRRERVSKPESVKVSVAFLDFEDRGEGRALVRFNQSYESNTFSDVVTKTLELAREDDEWKIVKETVDS